ncbi:copper fist DNA binding domain-containing protein [Rhodocollybia butyracea]|uniref:Copper fist DNA binding domain-containing protein n=1 Tax=Rhodocollybia butyracea TaxID=206335 RepID=A0A9P5Q5K1_9AGAR|nr:copper fist DNA binding domain-containing protein [Rhodocollybia butyracea]
MILFNEKKYACETCIKGHRTSGCRHTSRPLYEIKKKGRPITQCSHCRELRAKRQVHVKCICPKEEREERVFLRGLNRTLQKPAFPNGLPSAIETSVASQLSSESMSSDSEYGADCLCSSWRPSNRRKDTKTPAEYFTTLPSWSTDSPVSRTASHSSNRMAGYRHVLVDSYNEAFFGTMARHNLYQQHDYSPYGRASDRVRPNQPNHYLFYSKYPEFKSDQVTYSNGQRQFSLPMASPRKEPYGFDAAQIEPWNTCPYNVPGVFSHCDERIGTHNIKTEAVPETLPGCAEPATPLDTTYHQFPLNTMGHPDEVGMIDAWVDPFSLTNNLRGSSGFMEPQQCYRNAGTFDDFVHYTRQ